ncbi:MAG: caspase family protein [Chitinophagaceae bacterium]|nr:caspase family protein [Chitinophagaceae bacterium]
MNWAATCLLVCVLYKSVPAQSPHLVLPVGHTSSVSIAAYSPDSKYVVTASWDNTAKIWSAPEGRLLYDLKEHHASLTSAAYSHNGRYIVTTSKDSTAIIWSSSEGVFLHRLHGHSDWVTGATFSADDKQLITYSWDRRIKCWDVTSGKLLYTLPIHRQAVNAVNFSPDGKYYVTASKDSTAKIVQSATRKVLFVLKGHKDWVNAAAFSNDGKYVATASKDGTGKLWNAATGKSVYTLKGHTSSVNEVVFDPTSTFLLSTSNDGTCKAWSVKNGTQLYELKGHVAQVTGAAFSDNGQFIVTASGDNSARVWNAKTGQPEWTLDGHTAALTSAVFSNDGRYIVTASMDNSAAIWSVVNKKQISTLSGHTSVVTSASYSSDGKKFVTASWDNTAKIWNAADGKLLSNLKGHTDWINTASFSRDGNFVVTASSDNTAIIWSATDGHMIHRLTGHTDWVASAIFSDDGQYVVTTSWDNTSKIFLTATGDEITELKGHENYLKWINFSHDGKYIVTASADNTARIWTMPGGELVHVLKGHTDKVRTAEFTRDDKYIITAAWDSTAKLWDAATGKLKIDFKGHKGPLNSAILSPDGKYVTTISMDNTARIWLLESGKMQYELRAHSGSVNSGHYSKDGQRIVLGSLDNTASIWNADNGKLLHVLRGHSDAIKSAAFSPDRKFIITTSEDNTIKKWNAESGEFLYTFFAVDSIDYLAIDKDGHYDGTENARKLLYYVCGNEIVSLEQFKDLSWEPGLVAKLSGINNEPVTAKKISEISICNYTPLVEEEEMLAGNHNFSITPREGGLGEIQLFVNGKLVETFSPQTLPKNNNGYLLQVKRSQVEDFLLSGADNVITVKATTNGGQMVSRGVNQVAAGSKKPAVLPDMYIVGIGISQYKGEKLKLRYASKDAVDFTSAITSSAKKLLNGDGKQHVFSYSLNTETGSNRWPAKQSIQNLIDSISLRATSDDIVLIFFAGHGILQLGQKNFYLLTAEASNPDLSGVEKDVCISTEELKEWLRKIKANKQLLILDACNSGQVVQQLQELIDKRDIPADQQRALESLKDKTGTFILSASASGQSAYETSIYGQGLLTYSLLSGIKFGNGLKDNKFIDVTRWFNYACDNVKMMAREIGGRQDPQIIGNASFEIGLVDKEVLDSIHLASKKKVFRRSKFIEDEELLNDDLDLSYLVDRELNNLSAAGKESPLVFAADNQMSDAYSVRGKYDIEGNKVNVKVSLFKGQKERIRQFDLSTDVNRKDELAKKIADNIKLILYQTEKNGL